MKDRSLAKVKAFPLKGVGMIVDDTQKAAENYWNILGIGPWYIYELEPPILFNQTYRGKATSYGYQVALCMLEEFQLELVQPTFGESIYSDFLKKHGEGVHYLQYSVDTVDQAKKDAESFAKHGCPLIMEGYLGDGYCAFVDTSSTLKCIWQVTKMPSSLPAPIRRIPVDEKAVSPAKIKVKKLEQVAFAVKDIQETVKNYWDILGIGPWEIYDFGLDTLSNRTYHGMPGNFIYQIALIWAGPIDKYVPKQKSTKIGPVMLELCQPVSGDEIFSDFIKEHGDGIQHLAYRVDNLLESRGIMSEAGISVLQSSRVKDGGYDYYDSTKCLKCIIEFFEMPTKLPPLKSRYPK
jgi:hypothetical protein